MTVSFEDKLCPAEDDREMIGILTAVLASNAKKP
jgi:hypothetical protein